MSGFDPALLEGKDRSELAAIAEQLGEKPGARAKKADIVSLIMRLVGADEAPAAGAATETDGAATPAAADADADRQDPSGDADDSPGDAADGDATEDEAHADEAGSEDGHADADADAGGDNDAEPDAGNRRDRGDQNGNRNQGGQGNNGNRQGGGNQNGNQNAGNQQGSGNQNGGNQNGGNQNGGGQGDGQGDDLDSGNRRRRRRGRDRDRGRDDEQVQAEPVEVEGMVDLRDEGYGFLRLNGYISSRDDAYISVKQTRQFGLRTGDIVKGKSRPAGRNEKNPALLQVDDVNGFQAHNQPARPLFDDLTPVFPDERLTLEMPDDPSNLTVRIIDLLAPIGKGQRGLIASPPKAGKTTIVKHLVRSIEVNHPEVELIVLLVDERPEEVTDMKRWLLRGTVAASTFDRPAEEHTTVAELVIERAKRLVEAGKDVVVVLDGITRLARAYNQGAPVSGRTTEGGIELGALYPTKRFFGAARNAEEGGSLTIVATISVETGSRADEVIFEEFTGTGNMELKLDRRLAARRIFPAIDVDASSTRHDDLLADRAQLPQLAALRTVLAGLNKDAGVNAAGIEMLTDRLASTKDNAQFLAQIAKG